MLAVGTVGRKFVIVRSPVASSAAVFISMRDSVVILVASLATLAVVTPRDIQQDDYQFDLTEEQYHQMPRLFHLDEHDACLSQPRSLYCLGSFQLQPATHDLTLFTTLQRYSANWVDHFNHTRLHRGLCVSRRCPRNDLLYDDYEDRFESCVNDSMVEHYGLSARLYLLEGCRAHPEDSPAALHGSTDDLDIWQRAFLAVLAGIMALTMVSTVLDLTLPEHARKDAEWALAWSLPGCWRELTAASPPPLDRNMGDLRVCDGLRAFCMLCVVIEHVCWIDLTSYQLDPRFTETTRRAPDALLLSNSTLLVQVFFLLSSFLLANKILRQHEVPSSAGTDSVLHTAKLFCSTMLHRIVRIGPSYWLVLGFAATWWARFGSGPMWTSMVESEARVCRDKWWWQVSFLHNVVWPDKKCLIQTWYLAADLQLYAAALLFMLVLARRGAAGTRTALCVLGAAGCTVTGCWLVLCRRWSLPPTAVLHNPEAVRAQYAGDDAFNLVYQAPLGNLPGTLAGLGLAVTYRELTRRRVDLGARRWTRWATGAGAPLATLWVLLSPQVVMSAPPGGWVWAVTAAVERPVFALLVGAAVLGALRGAGTPWRSWLAWSGWRLPARLSFAVLLLHMPLHKWAAAGGGAGAAGIYRLSVIQQWGGAAVLSYLVAFPLALLVELPPARLLRALTQSRAAPPSRTPDKTPS